MSDRYPIFIPLHRGDDLTSGRGITVVYRFPSIHFNTPLPVPYSNTLRPSCSRRNASGRDKRWENKFSRTHAGDREHEGVTKTEGEKESLGRNTGMRMLDEGNRRDWISRTYAHSSKSREYPHTYTPLTSRAPTQDVMFLTSE